jgi:hypothetical protein
MSQSNAEISISLFAGHLCVATYEGATAPTLIGEDIEGNARCHTCTWKIGLRFPEQFQTGLWSAENARDLAEEIRNADRLSRLYGDKPDASIYNLSGCALTQVQCTEVADHIERIAFIAESQARSEGELPDPFSD